MQKEDGKGPYLKKTIRWEKIRPGKYFDAKGEIKHQEKLVVVRILTCHAGEGADLNLNQKGSASHC